VNQRIWLALSIGNSRYHWAWFIDSKLQSSWDIAYFPDEMLSQIVSANLTNFDLSKLLPIDLQHQIATNRLNIAKLAILGAGGKYGYPVLVIDGGTALTFTGVDDRRSLVGGAILPGLRLQFRSLATGTAALPELELPATLPARWSENTSDAIYSGILSTITAGIKDFILDWDRLFPHSSIVFTGGDGEILVRYMQSILPEALTCRVRFDRLLLFHGIANVVAGFRSP
jgi:type III pantothenate kinase